MWLVYIMEYYSAIKRSGMLIHVATQVNLENMMLVKKASQERLHIV